MTRFCGVCKRSRSATFVSLWSPSRELLYGVEVSPRRQQDEAALNAFLNYVEVLDFPDNASSHYAQIRAQLKKSGKMIGANDLFIAAHARSLGLTLVTHNTQEFRRVHRLAIEDWTSIG